MEIIIIGGGISGLATGLTLQERGHTVTIWAREFSPHTTSDVAAALWYPYLVEPAAQVAAWGQIAYQHYRADIAHPERGVLWQEAVLEAVAQPLSDDDLPAWRTSVANFRRARPDEVPPGFADGYCFDSAIIDMSLYMPALHRTFLAGGGRVEQRTVRDFAEAFAVAPMVVNCSGLGARELAHDPAVYPVRGQVARIPARGFRRALSADAGPLGLVYVIPRIHDIVLGGISAANDDNTTVVPEQTADILTRCQRFAPDLGPVTEAEISGVACGLRPARAGGVRVAPERIAPDRLLLHNYGHGGAGVTLAWGCAAAVADLLAAALK
jgi:D-amino-acid oxidase